MPMQLKTMLRLRASAPSAGTGPQAPGVGSYLLHLSEAEFHIETAIDDLLACPAPVDAVAHSE